MIRHDFHTYGVKTGRFSMPAKSNTPKAVRKPIEDKYRKLIDPETRTVYLPCQKCGCEFEVTERRAQSLQNAEELKCFDCATGEKCI